MQILHVLCKDGIEVMMVSLTVVLRDDDGGRDVLVVVVVVVEHRVLMQIIKVHNGMISRREMFEKSSFFASNFAIFSHS